jgi:VanZ family protein
MRQATWRERLMKWVPLLALYLFWPTVLLVCWGELNPHPPGLEGIIWDKALHFMAYFGLSGIATVALKADRRSVSAVLGLVLFGAALEVLQGFAGRDPSWYDQLANTLGAMSGGGMGWLLIQVLRSKILATIGRN